MIQSPNRTRRLTTSQERFCNLLATGRSQTAAWLKAGYRVSREMTRRNAEETLAKPNISASVAELRTPQTARESTFGRKAAASHSVLDGYEAQNWQIPDQPR